MSGDGSVPRNIVVRTGNARANYVLKEVVSKTSIANTGLDQFGSMVFTFSDLSNASAWASVWDRFRFLGVKVTFQARGVMTNILPATYSIPTFATVVDFDDDNAFTSMSAMQRCATYVGLPSNQNVIRHFLPRRSMEIYVSAVSTGYGEVDPKQWSDLGYPTIPFFGLKWGLGAASPIGQAAIYDILVEYVIELAGQRG
jgi:hypothetical protein